MPYIKGYKYLSEDSAIAARKQCADYYGLPKEDATTLYWVDYLQGDGFWYIVYDESIAFLGLPEDIEIKEDNPFED
jgi:hypothetical protein